MPATPNSFFFPNPIIEISLPFGVRCSKHDDTRADGADQNIEKLCRQREMSEVIRAELQLETVLGF